MERSPAPQARPERRSVERSSPPPQVRSSGRSESRGGGAGAVPRVAAARRMRVERAGASSSPDLGPSRFRSDHRISRLAAERLSKRRNIG